MPHSRPATPQLVTALDVPSSAETQHLLDLLPTQLEWFKVGLQLFIADGNAIIETLHARKKNIFLDLKLHDIPNTVSAAIHSAVSHGVSMLTLHASGGPEMISAAAQTADEYSDRRPLLVAVTTLTSLDQVALKTIGVERSVEDQVLALARMALDAGADGLVCSALEAARLRQKLGNKPILVTPGIRPHNTEINDQKRIATPATAVRDGSDFLVVGRPITSADDPAHAALHILEEMRQGASATESGR